MLTRGCFQSLKSNSHGHPVQRAMFLEFPHDRTTHYLDRQYMLGPNLLVAPVFVPEGEESEYYLPAGVWTSYFQPERTLMGPVWVNEVVPIDEIPVWVRPGSVLCLGPSGVGRPDYDFAKDVEVQVYELTDGQMIETLVPSGSGKRIAGTVRAAKGDNGVTVNVVSGTVGLSSVTVCAGAKVKRMTVDDGKGVAVPT